MVNEGFDPDTRKIHSRSIDRRKKVLGSLFTTKDTKSTKVDDNSHLSVFATLRENNPIFSRYTLRLGKAGAVICSTLRRAPGQKL